MKTIVSIVVFVVLLGVAPRACFALWDVLPVSKEKAKELGLLVRTRASGPNHVGVELEFKTEGNFKAFIPGGKFNDLALVQLWIGQGDNTHVTAALKEDRSQAGRVVVGFIADRVQLDQSNLRVMVPYTDGGLGGITYVLRVKDFVEPKKDR
jgi:hypothetical protein